MFFVTKFYFLECNNCVLSLIKIKNKSLNNNSNNNKIEVFISKALIELYISHDNFFSVDNVLREYNEMKEEIKTFWNFCGIYYINLVDISRKKYERNGVEKMV